jgi:hypothetical protein
MSTIQSQLVSDSSTFANYAQWASAISAAFQSFTWIQSADTGQVMWSGMNLTAVSMSGTTATYTFNTLTGLALTTGRALTITGMGNAGNNGTFVVTGVSGTTSGTFTVINAAGVNAAAQTGVVTKATVAPGSSAYFYEIWQPNDGLTVFYVKLEMGNTSGTNSPNARLTVGTTTDGAGTINSGITIGLTSVCPNGFTPASAVTQYECDFSGAAGRIGVMMWRNSPTNLGQWYFGIERSVNSVGSYTGTYVTLWTVGGSNRVSQQTLVFGTGATQSFSNTLGQWVCRVVNANSYTPVSSAFNGSIPFDTCSPAIGYFDYPCTGVGVVFGADLADGVTFTATVYGNVRTYMPGKAAGLNTFGSAGPLLNTSSGLYALCMRYD